MHGLAVSLRLPEVEMLTGEKGSGLIARQGRYGSVNAVAVPVMVATYSVKAKAKC